MASRLPDCVADVDKGRLCQALPGLVDADVLQLVHGTATKIHLELRYTDRTKRAWLKSGMEPHSRADGLAAVYAGEVVYYSRYADRFQTHTPSCLFAASDDRGRSLIILDDLLEAGARFNVPPQSVSAELVGRRLYYIAQYQAASWLNAELAGDPWLQSGGSHNDYDLPRWLYSAQRWSAVSALPRFRWVGSGLRCRETLGQAHRRLLSERVRQEPSALCHGDAHYGQAYILPDGKVRLLDWQAVQIAHWSHEIAYFIGSGLSVADRRAFERDLLRHYLDTLDSLDLPQRPGWKEAWRDYRTAMFYGIGWVFCPPEIQSEENCEVLTERFCTAIDDLGSIHLIHQGA